MTVMNAGGLKAVIDAGGPGSTEDSQRWLL